MAELLVGRYELEAPPGSGAMGEVWRGRDLATRRPVAVKLVQLAGIDDQARIAETIIRFRRAADTHQALKVTAATVANPGKIGRNSTVDVVSAIFTNGKGGPVTYRGAGTRHAVAIFQVFTPNVIPARSASFTCQCAA